MGNNREEIFDATAKGISASIALYARFRFAAFPTSDRQSLKCGVFCVQAAALLLSNTCAVQNLIIRGLERLLEPLAVRTQADHLLREPVETVQEAGFRIEYLKRLKLGIVERLIARKASQ